jgi:hypothetical protein
MMRHVVQPGDDVVLAQAVPIGAWENQRRAALAAQRRPSPQRSTHDRLLHMLVLGNGRAGMRVQRHRQASGPSLAPADRLADAGSTKESPTRCAERPET